MTDLLPVTQSDRDAVQAFHRTMAARLMADITRKDRPKLGEDEGDAGTLVQAFARHRLEALRTQGDGEGSGWASPSLGRAYHEVEKLRERLAQPSESGIDESLRRALDAIETADTEIIGVAS